MSKQEVLQQLANQDLMPGASVVQDFYKTEGIDPSLEDKWEPVEDIDLGDLNVPGYPDICPHRAWSVVTGIGTWIVYTWYDEPFGTNDDVWLYIKKESSK